MTLFKSMFHQCLLTGKSFSMPLLKVFFWVALTVLLEWVGVGGGGGGGGKFPPVV